MPVVMAQTGRESNRLNCIFASKENRGEIFGHLFNALSSSHFFNETDFEQSLLVSGLKCGKVVKLMQILD